MVNCSVLHVVQLYQLQIRQVLLLQYYMDREQCHMDKCVLLHDEL
jgi:hypothetical protein